jgi:transposase-like protein
MGTILAEVVDTGGRDARGRRMLSVVQRAEYVRAYHASGLNQAAFAKREGLRYSTFCHWVQKAARGELRAPTTPAAREPRVQFAQVQLPAAAAAVATQSASIEVRLGDGVVVRGDDVQKLAALVKALRS